MRQPEQECLSLHAIRVLVVNASKAPKQKL